MNLNVPSYDENAEIYRARIKTPETRWYWSPLLFRVVWSFNLKSISMAYLTFLIDILAVVSFLALIQAIHDYRRRSGLSYPPGPQPLPIVGNLLDIPRNFSWLAYTQYSKTYGISVSFPEVPF
jgi:hypothetical protein